MKSSGVKTIMKVLKADIRLSSMVSMRCPLGNFTYPMPPPLTIKGLLANALWQVHSTSRGEDGQHPALTWLKLVEDNLDKRIWVQPKGLIVSGYSTLKSIFSKGKGGDGGKLILDGSSVLDIDILPRQFLFAPEGFRVFVASEDGSFLDAVADALRHAPVYLGDSEGLANVMNPEVVEAKEEQPSGPVPVSVYFPDDLALNNGIDGDGGTLYWVNERAIMPGEKKDKQDAMVSYLFPVIQHGKTFRPSELIVRFNGKARLLKAFGEVLPLRKG